MRYKNTLLVIIILIILVALFGSINNRKTEKLSQTQKELSFFETSTIEARAVYIYDVLGDRVLYEKNGNEIFPIASLTKLMTSFVALEEAPMGTIITINSDSLKKDGDTGLYPGEKWMLKKLIQFTLVTSSNDGASAIANAFNSKLETDNQKKESFVDKMNNQSIKLGLSNTYFLNETGLDEPSGVGAYSSARDVSILLAQFLKKYPELLEETSYKIRSIRSEDKIHNIENTNKEVNKISGLLASKTGFTDLAGGNLFVAFDVGIDQPIIITVLGSTLEGRFRDVEILSNKVREYINQYR